MYCLVPQKKHDFFLSLPINLDIAIARINTYMKSIFQLNFLLALPIATLTIPVNGPDND